MELQVRMPEELDELALLDLRDWLLSERQLRGRVTLMPAENSSDHLGGAWDAVAISLGSGGVAVVFLQSFSEWIKRRRPETKIECKTKHGDIISFTNIEPDKALELIQGLCDSRDLEGHDDTTP